MSNYTDASLIYYPSGYKAGTAYSLKPTDGSGDLTFTRASTAIRVNESGLIEEVASNVPRIDYTGGGCGKLLLEPSRSNLALYSEPTTNEGAASNITYESFNWDIGFENCVKFGDNSALRFRYFSTVAASTTYTISAYVIMEDLSEPSIGTNVSDGDFVFRVGGVYPTITSKQNMGNNIWRCEGYATATNTSQTGIMKYTSQSNKGFRVVGLQVEAGSYATSYIPTAGATATRLADAASKTGISSLIGQTEGTMFVDFDIDSARSTSVIAWLTDGTTNNAVISSISSGGLLQVVVNSGGTTYVNIVGSVLGEGRYKLSVAYKLNDVAVFLNGALLGTDSSVIMPLSLSRLDVGQSTTATAQLGGSISQALLFKTRLSNTDLAALTTL